MQPSAAEQGQPERVVPLRVRVSPSEKRRLERVVRLSDAGTIQAFLYDALIRAMNEQEDRLSPILSRLHSAPEQPAWMNLETTIGLSGEG